MQFTLTMERVVQFSTEEELSASSLSEAIAAAYARAACLSRADQFILDVSCGSSLSEDIAAGSDLGARLGRTFQLVWCETDATYPQIVAIDTKGGTVAALQQRDWKAFKAFTTATLSPAEAFDATIEVVVPFKVHLERYALARAHIRVCAKSADAAIKKVCSMIRSEFLDRWGDEFDVDESTLTGPRVYSAEALDDESVFAELEISEEVHRAYSAFLRDGIEGLADTRLCIAASYGGTLSEGPR